MVSNLIFGLTIFIGIYVVTYYALRLFAKAIVIQRPGETKTQALERELDEDKVMDNMRRDT